jgi:hypothetical protein
MSLKSGKSIDQSGADNHVEKITIFRLNNDQTYTKITKSRVRDWKTSGVKSGRIKDVEDGPYRIGDKNNFDDFMIYEDVSGEKKTIYFKKTD